MELNQAELKKFMTGKYIIKVIVNDFIKNNFYSGY